MSGFEKEIIEAAAEVIKARGWWIGEDTAKFLEEWAKLRSDRVLMADSPTGGADLEKRVVDVLGDLAGDRIGKGAAEQIKDAAEQSVRRQIRDGGLIDAIRPR